MIIVLFMVCEQARWRASKVRKDVFLCEIHCSASLKCAAVTLDSDLRLMAFSIGQQGWAGKRSADYPSDDRDDLELLGRHGPKSQRAIPINYWHIRRQCYSPSVIFSTERGARRPLAVRKQAGMDDVQI